ncbi:MAG TPA: ABC transporter permease [Gammaproteobacteria bacterium]|nr:ABC transporter permease [Gammaproteobacteria bacterium]
MMNEDEIHKSYLPRDWRIIFALALTFLWFTFLAIYIARNVGWGSFPDLPIDEMGAFLEGAFAFLAFLWLVIGLFIQQSVLAENNEELRRNNLHSEKQTLAIAATELNARQETLVLELRPFHSAQYVIPLAGMVFASAMNSISICAEGFQSERNRGEKITVAREFAFKAALIPITNALFDVGLVSLPGMMTGQIIAGVDPPIAARYQIMVMCMLFSSAGLSAACFLYFLTRRSE